MTSRDPRAPSASASKDERLAKALRENLARRKALQRAKRTRDTADPMVSDRSPSSTPDREDDPQT